MKTQTVVQSEAGYQLRSNKIQLKIVLGPDSGQAFVLPGPEATIGCGPECEVVLSDRTVSRHHLTLRVEPGGLRVVDAQSRNGTRLDGLRVFDAIARPDSQLSLGQTKINLTLLPDTIDLPLSERARFGGLLGKSVAMRRLFAVLERVAKTHTTVLIEGETGTGKELIAEAIHDEGPRGQQPFVVFDCSAVSAQLIESELFGHQKGAFTGALSDRVGAFEAANGGTLFLDEVGELPLDMQPKLLRALEKQEIRPVGTHQYKEVDVRIVAATNRRLSQEVELGRFREDLFYRLNVVQVRAVPLRERPEDVPLLIEHFWRLFQKRHGEVAPLPAEVVKGYKSQAWPGNVRALKNAVHRALSVGPPNVAALDEPPPTTPTVDLEIPLKVAREAVVEAFERAYISAALDQTEGNISKAAALSGVHRKFIHRAINQYGLRKGPISR